VTSLHNSYDVIVVGAGPSGSVAARKCAQAGLSTLLIEKRQEIGAPVRCAEAIGIPETVPYIDIDDRWINARISHYAIHNSEGHHVKVQPGGPTLIVDRKVFDWELAHLAANAGAVVRTRTQAEGLEKDASGKVTGVRINSMGKRSTVQAKLIFAADGTESQVVRWAGLKSVPPMSDFYVGFQYLLGGMRGKMSPGICEYHLGNTRFPGGYGWVFPKGEDTANVGLVISADNAKDVSAQEYLDRFCETNYPDAPILGAVAGGIPATGALKKMVTDHVMAIGDAAHQADPLTAGGINLGMIGADMASQVAINAFKTGDFSAKALSEYETLWRDRFARMHHALYQVRKLLTRMDDERIGEIIHTASTLDLEHLSLGQIALTILRNHPLLLIQAQTLIVTGLIMK